MVGRIVYIPAAPAGNRHEPPACSQVQPDVMGLMMANCMTGTQQAAQTRYAPCTVQASCTSVQL